MSALIFVALHLSHASSRFKAAFVRHRVGVFLREDEVTVHPLAVGGHLEIQVGPDSLQMLGELPGSFRRSHPFGLQDVNVDHDQSAFRLVPAISKEVKSFSSLEMIEQSVVRQRGEAHAHAPKANEGAFGHAWA